MPVAVRRGVLRRPFGSTGAQVPVIGQGTWAIRDAQRAEAALRRGLELGLAHIDTAEMYRGSEETIARAIAGRRDDVFLVSKVLPQNASRSGTVQACEGSLRRLATDHLDVYLLHAPSERHAIADTMAGMGELLDRGLTGWVGVSNFGVEELEEAQSALGARRIACDQVLYHLGDRGIEHELVPFCKKKAVAVVAYSPFGGPRASFPPRGKRGAEALERSAKKHGKTPRQVALNFLTREPHVFSIPKAESEAHVEENAGAVGWRLDGDDHDLLDEAFPVGRPRGLGVP